MHRRHLLLAMPGLLLGGAAVAQRGLPRPDFDPLLGDVPICRSAPRRIQYMQGRDAAGGAAADAQLLEALGLLEGHMMIGRALVDAGQRRLGLPHFGHPVTELYTWLEPRIAERGASPFDAQLTALEAAARDGTSGAQLAPLYQAAEAGLAGLRATVAPARLADRRFQLDHVATMIDAVAGDYGESIERGRIANVLEYHDSAGFLRYAIATAGRLQASLPDPRWTPVLGELEGIRATAYAELLPPPRPPVSITAIRRRADAVRALAEQA